MSKNVLILGANGMLGGSLHRYFSATANNVIGTVRSNIAQKNLNNMGFDNVISGIDVTDHDALANVISNTKPDYIFNCVGLIKQVEQGNHPVLAIEINSLLPHKLAELATKFGARLIHFSTDCVFSGSTGSYTENDIPDATDIYGRSKLLGEVAYDNHLTLRTSIIGHEIDSNVSLIDWFLSQTGSVNGFSNAIFSGLPTCYVAEFINDYIFPNPSVSGLYHLSVDPINKYDLLNLVKSIYSKDIVINDSPEFKIDRSLNSNSLRDVVHYNPPVWQDLITRMHDEYRKFF